LKFWSLVGLMDGIIIVKFGISRFKTGMLEKPLPVNPIYAMHEDSEHN
jgi:hypothetical protein